MEYNDAESNIDTWSVPLHEQLASPLLELKPLSHAEAHLCYTKWPN